LFIFIDVDLNVVYSVANPLAPTKILTQILLQSNAEYL